MCYPANSKSNAIICLSLKVFSFEGSSHCKDKGRCQCFEYKYCGLHNFTMSDDSDSEVPELVVADIKKVPITVITGFLGLYHKSLDRSFFFLIRGEPKPAPKGGSRLL
jgi:hypothetical protein